jgi:VRR-NUC domain
VTADAHVMTERELQEQVLDLARMLGYLAYHTYDSRRSVEGFPDLVLVHERSGALIFAELKSPTGRVTTAQDRWLRAVALRGVAYVWRPEHLRDGSVVRALQRHARTGPPA